MTDTSTQAPEAVAGRLGKAELLSDGEALIPARKVWERYDVTDRTLDRWLHRLDLNFPRPIRILGRRYFKAGDLAVWERERALQHGRAA